MTPADEALGDLDAFAALTAVTDPPAGVLGVPDAPDVHNPAGVMPGDPPQDVTQDPGPVA